MVISKKHSNRRLHNWLLYNIGDSFREKYSKLYTGKMYDLGCGEAPYKDYFLKYVDEYIGVDWEKTPHTSHANVISDLNTRFEIEDEVADTVISISVMEHLHNPQNFLDEAFRIMKQDAVFILQVPWQWHIHESPHDYFRYTPYGLKYMLEKSGFYVDSIEPTTGFFTTQIIKTNYFSLRFIGKPKALRFLIKSLLIPLWFVGQIIAPWLDKLDRNKALETQGYYVIAKK